MGGGESGLAVVKFGIEGFDHNSTGGGALVHYVLYGTLPAIEKLTDADVGGIDMNNIDVNRQGGGVSIQFDPVEAQQFIDMGITGFAPVIINITPLPSVLPLLGLAPQREEEEFELSKN